jgi:hypothetical protein
MHMVIMTCLIFFYTFLPTSLLCIAVTHYSLMSMKRFLVMFLVPLALFAPIALSSAVANAEEYVATCPPGQTVATDAPEGGGKYVCCPNGTEDNATRCFFALYVNPAVYLLTALAGVAAVFGIASGGIQYAASAGDPQKVAAGKAKVTKALYGVVGFMFLFSALQFLSPGGFSQKNTVPPGASNRAEACSSSFFGLKPWFAYLPNEKFDDNCQIQEFNLLGSGTAPNNTPSDFGPVALAIVDNLVRIAAVVAVVFVVIGGVKYVTSQGEPEGTKAAKDSIINAIIGLVIAIIAASVVSFIGNQIT